MTTPQEATTQPLWSDSRIINAWAQSEDADDVRAKMYQIRNEYEAELASLRAELAEAKRWAPNVMSYQTGVLSTLIETANAPGEDEAWAHLQEDDDDMRRRTQEVE